MLGQPLDSQMRTSLTTSGAGSSEPSSKQLDGQGDELGGIRCQQLEERHEEIRHEECRRDRRRVHQLRYDGWLLKRRMAHRCNQTYLQIISFF